MFLCPWDFPSKNAEVGCCILLQGTFLTQGSNPCLLHLLFVGIGKTFSCFKIQKAQKSAWCKFPSHPCSGLPSQEASMSPAS